MKSTSEVKSSSLGSENKPYIVPTMYLDDPIVKLLLNAGAKAHTKNATVPLTPPSGISSWKMEYSDIKNDGPSEDAISSTRNNDDDDDNDEQKVDDASDY